MIKILSFTLLQYGTFFEKDEKAKAEKTKKVIEETIPKSLVKRKIFFIFKEIFHWSIFRPT